MKTKIIFLIFFSTITFSCITRHQSKESIDLTKEWKFQKGDSTEYSKPGYDDKWWKTIQTGNPWENQGFTDYDGVAWYRANVVIPSSLRKSNSTLKSVRLSLGQIADSDVTYFNGKRIGRTNGRDAERIYIIPFDTISWDKENVIAIRVNNRRGNGGMYAGACSIDNTRLTDIVFLK